MSKSLKFNEYLEIEKEKQIRSATSKNINTFSQRNAINVILGIVGIITAVTILTLAYNSEPIYFKNLLIGFFIIGLIICVKIASHQKTTIQRVKK